MVPFLKKLILLKLLAIDEMIKKANGKRTIPQIFLMKAYWGYDEVRALEKENKLKNLLK